MKKVFFVLASLIVLGGALLLSSCSRQASFDGSSEDKIQAMVSVLPQVYFVERIGGDKVQVEAMIPPGFSPATYDPSPEQLIKLQEAEFYFRIGKIAFEEAQMDKLAQMNKGMRIVDTSQGITFEYLAEHSHEEDGDDRDHESESGVDPHIWLSPRLVKIQAEHIYEALAELAPENQEYFLANYNNFIRDLDDVDSHLETAFAPMKGGAILVFHPAFGYLANQYGFEQRAIEIEGKDPSPEHLKEIIDQAIADDIKVIFVQKQFSTKSASAVAEAIGGTVVQIDPLAQDYLNNLEEMAGAIVNNIK